MRRVRVVIQSRLNSSRLPGKAMLTVAGMPLIELVARRASRSGHEVVVATSDEQYDQRIARHLRSVGIEVVQGDLDDVLGRFVLATQDLDDDDRVVRLTGDNPLADSDLVDELLAAMDASGHTYGRVDIEQAPEGIGCEGFTARSLRDAAEQATDAYDREHVTPWLRRELGELLFVPQGCPSDIRGYRATVDCLDDFDRVTRLFDDVEDPIGIGWLPLMEKLGSRLESTGGTVPMAAAGGLSRLVLDAAPLTSVDAAVGRALASSAVEHGVTHVLAGAGQKGTLAALRAATEPALVQRMAVLVELPSTVVVENDESVAAHLRLELALERCFSALGRRKVDTVLVPASLLAATGEWLRDTVQSGVAGRAGVVLTEPAELDLLDDLSALDVLLVRRAAGSEGAWASVADRLAAADALVLLSPSPASDEEVAATSDADLRQALGQSWADAVLVAGDSPDAVTAAVRATAS